MTLFVASSAVSAQPQGVANTSLPTISGSPVVGKILTASVGTWTWKGPQPTPAYQWQDCDTTGKTCVAIAKATLSTYTVATADVGHTIEVSVTEANKFGSLAASSLPTAVVTAPAPTPTTPAPDTTPPTVPTNFATTGAQQNSIAVSWTASTDPDSPVAGYTLYRNNTQAGTATGTSSTFSNLACGTSYSLAIDAYDAAGNHSAKTTAITGTTAACPTTATAPANSTKPAISGTPQVGGVLTTSNGTWNGTTPMTYTYKWYDCDSTGQGCTQITTATSGVYTVATTDQGHTIEAQVTAKNTAGSASAMTPPTGTVQAPPAAAGLHVSGNQLLDASGALAHLHGVNYSGPEYACIQGWGIFDGPSDQTMVTALKSWHVNIVRLPLNEDCWLGINGVSSAYGGANYQNAIVNFVNLLHQNGIYAELSLIWGAPGTQQATSQPAAPDADHSPAFWSSLATTFKGDPNVILAPWGETTLSASCFLNGGNCGAGYTSAGMQQAVNLMRQAGYNGVISIPGIDYANNLTQWLTYEPSDPQKQLIAEAHIYGKNTCDTTSCFDSQLAPVAAVVPLIFGETGETYDDSDCGSSYISSFMNWADAHNVGYEAWTWDTWGTCGSLISNFNGTAANGYGSWVQSHYASVTGSSAPSTTSTTTPTTTSTSTTTPTTTTATTSTTTTTPTTTTTSTTTPTTTSATTSTTTTTPTTTTPTSSGQQVGVFDLGWAPSANVPWGDVTQDFLFALETTANSAALDSHLLVGVNAKQWAATVHAHPGVKAIITIGGSSDQNWETSCGSSTYQAQFVSNLVNYATTNGFDGIDLDMEDNTWSAQGPPSPAMTACIEAVVQAAHAKGLLVTGDVITNWQGPWWAPAEKAGLGPDQYNLMTYGDNLSQLQADVQTEISQGLPAGKLTVGIDTLDAGEPSGGCGQFASYAASAGLKGAFVWEAENQAADGNVCLNQLAGTTPPPPSTTTSTTTPTSTTTGTSTTTPTTTTTTTTTTTPTTTTTTTPPLGAPPAGLHVFGNMLLDANSNQVHLHGVDRSGWEYACVQGWGFSDGPADQASVGAIRSWNSNIVHIGLNEDCMLGINGVPAAYSGANYMNAVVAYVNLLHANGMYAHVNIFWAAPGTASATGQPNLIDQDHGPAALTLLANTFKNDPNTILGVTEEPHNVDWPTWLNGSSSYVGMQQAVNIIRATGATNVIAVSGNDYANDLSQFTTYMPNDPLHNIIAQMDIYGNNTCGTPTCLNSTVAPVTAAVPVIFGEYGETYDASSCGSTATQAMINWADAHNVGYEGWTWDTWGDCESMISSYSGTPYSYGTWAKSHYLSLPPY